MHDTPKSLLQRVQSGPAPDDWRRLTDLYTPFLEQIVQHFGLFDADRDDLVQDVFTIVVREIARFEHNEQRGAFRRWLRTITVNRMRELWRARSVRTGGGQADLSDLESRQAVDGELERIWDQEHDAWVVNRLLEVLRPEFTTSTWQAFSRQLIDGASAAQVAAELGMTVNAVLIAKSRILRRLREEIRGLIE